MTKEINMVFLNELFRTQNIEKAGIKAGVGFRAAKSMIASAQRRGIMMRRPKFEPGFSMRDDKAVEFDIVIKEGDIPDRIAELQRLQNLICEHDTIVAIRNGTLIVRVLGKQEVIDSFWERVVNNPVVHTAYRLPGLNWKAPVIERRRARGNLVKCDTGYKVFTESEPTKDITVDEFPVVAKRIPFVLLEEGVIEVPQFLKADLLTLNRMYKGCNATDVDGEGNDRINKLIELLSDGGKHSQQDIADYVGIKLNRVPYLIKKTRAMRGKDVILTHKGNGMCVYEKGGPDDKA